LFLPGVYKKSRELSPQMKLYCRSVVADLIMKEYTGSALNKFLSCGEKLNWNLQHMREDFIRKVPSQYKDDPKISISIRNMSRIRNLPWERVHDSEDDSDMARV
jgi:hypothetical protein